MCGLSFSYNTDDKGEPFGQIEPVKVNVSNQ